ncbi:MAG: 3-isopropylmalate dehydratase large subunit, partial [Synergistaceae bacterium]|nr:3-isopropylmalate dehydratase large subunit [Synergistaceae bacterium]
MTVKSSSSGGQTVIEKIFSSRGGRPVYAGDMIVARVDLVMATDGSGPLMLEYFRKMNGKSVFDPQKIIMVLDHYVPCPNDKVSGLQDSMRSFVSAGLGVLVDMGEGICHQILPEGGYIHPGELIVGGDSHSTAYGALNAAGIGVGSSDLASAAISGALWFKVPRTIRVEFRGRLGKGVFPKDLALYTVREIGGSGAAYKAVEFGGDGVAGLQMTGRFTICNLMAETGAKCAIMPADSLTMDYLDGDYSDRCVTPDPDARYEKTIEIDLASVEPMISLPHRADNAVPVKEAAGVPVQMGLIGTCTNGRLEDFKEALDAMGDGRVRPGFQLLVVPASRKIYAEMAG